MGSYLDIIRQVEKAYKPTSQHKEPVHEQSGPVEMLPCAPGGKITWKRAGQTQQGLVDFIHVDDTGTRWAFVTIGESWAAVNLKFVTLVEEEARDDPDRTH
jgi:hypothetical protein